MKDNGVPFIQLIICALFVYIHHLGGSYISFCYYNFKLISTLSHPKQKKLPGGGLWFTMTFFPAISYHVFPPCAGPVCRPKSWPFRSPCHMKPIHQPSLAPLRDGVSHQGEGSLRSSSKKGKSMGSLEIDIKDL